MINRKGDLLNNALSIIIAVIGIMIIFMGAYKIYQVYVNQDREAARNVADVLEAKINAIGEGENTTALVRGVKNWFIIGWSKDDENRPDKCYFDSCICVCTTGKDVLSLEEGWPEQADKEDGDAFSDRVDEKLKEVKKSLAKACQGNNGFCRKLGRDKIYVDGGGGLLYKEGLSSMRWIPFYKNGINPILVDKHRPITQEEIKKGKGTLFISLEK